MAVVNAFQDLLDTMRRVRFAVEFSRHDILEQFAAGYSENDISDISSNLRFQRY